MVHVWGQGEEHMELELVVVQVRRLLVEVVYPSLQLRYRHS